MVINSISGQASSDSDASSLTPNHYEVLGVGEEASQDEIKNAYFRLIREHRPLKNPEQFQRFNDAGFILLDPGRRGAYDQSRHNGRRMQVLVDQAAKAQETDPQKAIALLKNAIDMAPDVSRPRALLAQVLTRMEEYDNAEKQYSWLIRDNPRDETIRYKLARCLWLQKRFTESERVLQDALKVNARYHDALILLSRLQEEMKNTVLAAETLERAISNDSTENYADVDALLRLLVLYLQTERNGNAKAVGERLLRVIPSDNSARTSKAVQRILRRANELYQNEYFDAARFLLDCVSELAEGNEDTAFQRKTLLQALLLRKEARLLQADKLAEGALKSYLELRYLDRAPETLRQKLEVLLSRLQGEIALKPRGVISTIDYIHRQYPGIAGEQERLLTELYDRATKRLAANATWNEKSKELRPTNDESKDGPQKKRGLLDWLKSGAK